MPCPGARPGPVIAPAGPGGQRRDDGVAAARPGRVRRADHAAGSVHRPPREPRAGPARGWPRSPAGAAGARGGLPGPAVRGTGPRAHRVQVTLGHRSRAGCHAASSAPAEPHPSGAAGGPPAPAERRPPGATAGPSGTAERYRTQQAALSARPCHDHGALRPGGCTARPAPYLFSCCNEIKSPVRTGLRAQGGCWPCDVGNNQKAANPGGVSDFSRSSRLFRATEAVVSQVGISLE